MVSSQNIFNRSYMFMKCKSLIELSIYDSYKDIETDSNNIFIEPEYFYLNNILLMELILFEEKTIQKMRLILSILLYQKKRMRSQINQRYQIQSMIYQMNQKNIILLKEYFVIVYLQNIYLIYLIGILVMFLILVECLQIAFL